MLAQRGQVEAQLLHQESKSISFLGYLAQLQDPYREASEVFWSRSSDEAETAEESFWLCGRDAGLCLGRLECHLKPFGLCQVAINAQRSRSLI